MGQSSADGAGEPIVGKRPLPESSPCAATLTHEDEAAVVWFASLSKRQRQDIKAILEMNL